MKRSAALVVSMLIGALLVAAVPSGAGISGPDVFVLHGLGPAPTTVDIYAGGTDATEWGLMLEAVDYTDLADVGTLPPGGHNILICNAVTDPDPTVTSCPEGAQNGNFGTNITLPSSGSVTIVAAYAGLDEPAAGRPTVVVFENDISCFDPGQGRLGARHAAAAPDVDVLITAEPGPITVSDVAFGEGVDADLDTGPATMEIVLSSDDSNVLGPAATPVPDGALRIEYVVGNPQQDAQFELLEQVIDLDPCPVDTTTTTTSTTSTSTTTTTEPDETTTTTAPPAQPAPIVPAVPTFTG